MQDAILTFLADGLVYKVLAAAMVLGGMALLALALRLGHHISQRKRQRQRRFTAWSVALLLVYGFLVAYAAFLAILLIQPGQGTFVLIGAIFLGGAVFVWLVIKSSIDAIEEISRLIENAPDAIILVDVDLNAIVEVNENACRLTGLPRHQMIGSDLEMLRSSTVALRPGKSLAREWHQRLTADANDSFEWTFDNASRQQTPCEVRLSMLPEDGISLLRISLIDISARLQAQMAVRISQERFAKVFHGSPDYITITRLGNGVIIDANEGFERVSGWRREDAIGHTALELGIWLDPAERDTLKRTIERMGRMREIEFKLGRKNGEQCVGLLSASTIIVDDEHLIVEIIRDISDFKRVQGELEAMNNQLERRVAERTEALTASNAQLRGTLETLERAQDELVRTEKLSSLGAMVAGVAHELNTPLGNSVMVASTFADKTRDFSAELANGQLRRSALDSYVNMAREASSMLSQNLQQASELITHFKQLAVDQTSAQRRAFELSQVVGDVLLSLRQQFKKTSHHVESSIPPGLMLDSYPGPLGQVLTNLINNAILHGFERMPSGQITITAQEVDNDQVMLDITDNGAGIPKDIQPRIFDPFFTTRLGRGGSGLGLHLVFGIVTRVLGGRIELDSQPGVGTRFSVRLPRIAPQGSPEPASGSDNP